MYRAPEYKTRMPTRPPSPCRQPGCAALVPSGGYCDAHKKQSPAHGYEERRRNDASVKTRRGGQWRKVSQIVRAQNPLCCDPFGHHKDWPAISQQVHHIQPADTHPDLIFVSSNLAAVCHRCHAEVEAMHKAGKPTAHLFTQPGGG